MRALMHERAGCPRRADAAAERQSPASPRQLEPPPVVASCVGHGRPPCSMLLTLRRVANTRPSACKAGIVTRRHLTPVDNSTPTDLLDSMTQIDGSARAALAPPLQGHRGRKFPANEPISWQWSVRDSNPPPSGLQTRSIARPRLTPTDRIGMVEPKSAFLSNFSRHR